MESSSNPRHYNPAAHQDASQLPDDRRRWFQSQGVDIAALVRYEASIEAFLDSGKVTPDVPNAIFDKLRSMGHLALMPAVQAKFGHFIPYLDTSAFVGQPLPRGLHFVLRMGPDAQEWARAAPALGSHDWVIHGLEADLTGVWAALKQKRITPRSVVTGGVHRIESLELRYGSAATPDDVCACLVELLKAIDKDVGPKRLILRLPKKAVHEQPLAAAFGRMLDVGVVTTLTIGASFADIFGPVTDWIAASPKGGSLVDLTLWATTAGQSILKKGDDEEVHVVLSAVQRLLDPPRGLSRLQIRESGEAVDFKVWDVMDVFGPNRELQAFERPSASGLPLSACLIDASMERNFRERHEAAGVGLAGSILRGKGIAGAADIATVMGSHIQSATQQPGGAHTVIVSSKAAAAARAKPSSDDVDERALLLRAFELHVERDARYAAVLGNALPAVVKALLQCDGVEPGAAHPKIVGVLAGDLERTLERMRPKVHEEPDEIDIVAPQWPANDPRRDDPVQMAVYQWLRWGAGQHDMYDDPYDSGAEAIARRPLDAALRLISVDNGFVDDAALFRHLVDIARAGLEKAYCRAMQLAYPLPRK